MTHSNAHPNPSSQDRFGKKLTLRLSESAEALPHDISERLRIARIQALGQIQVAQARTATPLSSHGGVATLTFGDEKTGLWGRLASLLPLIALVGGLVAINIIQNDDRARELAEIDAALLTDDLPPAAYTDPGFTQFLRSLRDQAQ